MIDLIAALWPFAVLVYLPMVAVVISSALFWVVRSRLDHQIPDDLPHTAGEWLQQELDESGLVLDVRAIVAGDDKRPGVDGYHVRSGIILLSPETHFKRDPVYWAVAAHELGHARLWSRSRLLTSLFTIAQWAKWALASFGIGITLGNILYAMPGVTELGYRCLTIALVLHTVTLLDEAIASTFAIRALRRSAALTRSHLQAVRTVLLAAFLTYLSSFFAHAVLLTQWQLVVELTGDGRFDLAAPLGGAALVTVAIGSLLGVAYAIRRLFTALSTRVSTSPLRARSIFIALGALIWQGMLPVLLWLLWDQRDDTTYRWCVLLACIPASSLAITVLRLPLLVVFLAINGVATRIRARHGIERSAVFERARRDGAALIKAGNLMVLDLDAQAAAEPQWRQRLAALPKLLYLPLLFAYWM